MTYQLKLYFSNYRIFFKNTQQFTKQKT